MRLHSLLDIAERELEVVYSLTVERESETQSLYRVDLHARDSEGTECSWSGSGLTADRAAERVYDKMVRWLDGD
jgi:hypothetical protein